MKTTKKTNLTKIFDRQHIHFGGRIYPSDFNTNYHGKDNPHGSPIAARIEADLQWEKNTLHTNKSEAEK